MYSQGPHSRSLSALPTAKPTTKINRLEADRRLENILGHLRAKNTGYVADLLKGWLTADDSVSKLNRSTLFSKRNLKAITEAVREIRPKLIGEKSQKALDKIDRTLRALGEKVSTDAPSLSSKHHRASTSTLETAPKRSSHRPRSATPGIPLKHKAFSHDVKGLTRPIESTSMPLDELVDAVNRQVMRDIHSAIKSDDHDYFDDNATLRQFFTESVEAESATLQETLDTMFRNFSRLRNSLGGGEVALSSARTADLAEYVGLEVREKVAAEAASETVSSVIETASLALATPEELRDTLVAFIAKKQAVLFEKAGEYNSKNKRVVAPRLKRAQNGAVTGVTFNVRFAQSSKKMESLSRVQLLSPERVAPKSSARSRGVRLSPVRLLSPSPGKSSGRGIDTVRSSMVSASEETVGIKGKMFEWLQHGEADQDEVVIPKHEADLFDTVSVYLLSQLKGPSGENVEIKFESEEGEEAYVPVMPGLLEREALTQQELVTLVKSEWAGSSKNKSSEEKDVRIKAKVRLKVDEIVSLKVLKGSYTIGQQDKVVRKIGEQWTQFTRSLSSLEPALDNEGHHIGYIAPRDTASQASIAAAAKKLNDYVTQAWKIPGKNSDLKAAVRETFDQMRSLRFISDDGAQRTFKADEYLVKKNPYQQYLTFDAAIRDTAQWGDSGSAADKFEYLIEALRIFSQQDWYPEVGNYDCFAKPDLIQSHSRKGSIALAMVLIGGQGAYKERFEAAKEDGDRVSIGSKLKILNSDVEHAVMLRKGFQAVYDNLDVLVDTVSDMNKAFQVAFLDTVVDKAKALLSDSSGYSLTGPSGQRITEFDVVNKLKTRVVNNEKFDGGIKERLISAVAEVSARNAKERGDLSSTLRPESRAIPEHDSDDEDGTIERKLRSSGSTSALNIFNSHRPSSAVSSRSRGRTPQTNPLIRFIGSQYNSVDGFEFTVKHIMESKVYSNSQKKDVVLNALKYLNSDAYLDVRFSGRVPEDAPANPKNQKMLISVLMEHGASALYDTVVHEPRNELKACVNNPDFTLRELQHLTRGLYRDKRMHILTKRKMILEAKQALERPDHLVEKAREKEAAISMLDHCLDALFPPKSTRFMTDISTVVLGSDMKRARSLISERVHLKPFRSRTNKEHLNLVKGLEALLENDDRVSQFIRGNGQRDNDCSELFQKLCREYQDYTVKLTPHRTRTTIYFSAPMPVLRMPKVRSEASKTAWVPETVEKPAGGASSSSGTTVWEVHHPDDAYRTPRLEADDTGERRRASRVFGSGGSSFGVSGYFQGRRSLPHLRKRESASSLY